jgi:Glycerophosphoryl diester phosphodiesterase family/B12 binding domain
MAELKRICDAAVGGNAKASRALTEQPLAEGINPLKLVSDYMVPATAEAERRFECNRCFVPVPMRTMLRQAFAVAAGVALTVLSCATGTNTAQPARRARMTGPAVYGHQGAQYERPPNTVASFARAAALGVGSEMDVQAEKGGWPVIMHNTTIDWSTGATGSVAQLEWSYLSTLRATVQAPWNTSAWKDEHDRLASSEFRRGWRQNAGIFYIRPIPQGS